MSERRTGSDEPPRMPPGAPPTGAPQALVVEGIFDGRVGDAAALQTAVADLSRCGAGRFRADVSGGRFSMLPVETHVPPAGFDEAAQADFLDRLQQVAAAALPGSIETNLRCKLVYADQVAETLFVVRDGALEPVTRHRARTAHDAAALPPTAAAEAKLGLRRREILWLAPLLLLAAALFAWRSGWIDRVLAARAESLQRDTGPFADMLTLTAERSWGNYVVELRRGPGYPATPAELAARRDRSEDLTARAACELVGNGGELFVQLAREDGEVLVETRIELRELLSDQDGAVTAKLPGQMSAHAVKLSLSAARRPQ